MPRTLVIGDVHGHLDRLEALLKQEGVLVRCTLCNGQESPYCPQCDGESFLRDDGPMVIQLGDLAHNGSGRNHELGPYGGQRLVPGDSTADTLCWDAAIRKGWVDLVLWGNHDAAVFDQAHEFTGYIRPKAETEHIMKLAASTGRLKLATVVDGFLLTHAGIHSIFKNQKHVPEGSKTDPEIFANWLNELQTKDETDGLSAEKVGEMTPEEKDFVAIRDAISKKRGGPSPVGGILWRDANEKLYSPFRQIFGHTKGDKIRKYETPNGWSYCIDVGDQFNGRLAGIWLPDEEIVEVKL